MTDQERKAALDAMPSDYTEIEYHGVEWLDQHYETIRAALSSPIVPVIEGLDEAISEAEGYVEFEEMTRGDAPNCWVNIMQAARAYAALPKLQKVDLDGMKRVYTVNGDECREYNRAIDDIKSKYGELYAEVKP